MGGERDVVEMSRENRTRDLGVLQAAEEGVGLYRRLGFEAFGGITKYKPPSIT